MGIAVTNKKGKGKNKSNYGDSGTAFQNDDKSNYGDSSLRSE
jgi:hypothetical protein